ncbi:hypothetical protein BDF22DRAFT_741939 [Syncephalis plumigaleata]|nr:hypothetical protein BDF22DRAFT_741939 [Syncephalis plumigaleata]
MPTTSTTTEEINSNVNQADNEDTHQTKRIKLRKRPYACTYPDCTKAYEKPCRLEEHIRSHTGERPFACEYPGCGKRFLRESHLNAHYRTHNPDHERAFVCDVNACQKRFATSTRLERHRLIHLRPFKCHIEGCYEAFNSETRLHFHLCRHDNRMPYACPESDCNASFRTPYDLKRHFLLHTNSRVYMCGRPGCQESFNRLSLLQRHIREDHVISCDICGEIFKKPEYLKEHHLIHSGEPRVRTCPYPSCNKQYISRSGLNTHIRVNHQQKESYGCDLCGQQFGYKHVLQKHVRLHVCTSTPTKKLSNVDATDKPLVIATTASYAEDPKRRFFCLVPGCLRRFGRFYDLDRHCRSMHPELEDKPSVDPDFYQNIPTSPIVNEQAINEATLDDTMLMKEIDELVLLPTTTVMNTSIESVLDIPSMNDSTNDMQNSPVDIK